MRMNIDLSQLLEYLRRVHPEAKLTLETVGYSPHMFGPVCSLILRVRNAGARVEVIEHMRGMNTRQIAAKLLDLVNRELLG